MYDIFHQFPKLKPVVVQYYSINFNLFLYPELDTGRVHPWVGLGRVGSVSKMLNNATYTQEPINRWLYFVMIRSAI